MISGGARGSAIVTAAGGYVGLGDSLLVRSVGTEEVIGDGVSASAMLTMAAGL
jgi:hypothetical protein